MAQSNPPNLTALWFHGSVPKRDLRANVQIDHSKINTWTPFNERDSNEIESAFIQKHTQTVPVQQDLLMQVDISINELSPIYWLGPIHEVRRGTWFMFDGRSYIPVDSSLSNQLEIGYFKIKPFNPLPLDDKQSPTKETKFPLFGSYMNQYVIFRDSFTADLLSDSMTSKIAKIVLDKLGVGIKLVRGWDECKRMKTASRIVNPTSNDESINHVDGKGEVKIDDKEKETVESTMQPDIEEEAQDRKIDHLIFVVPGIGQKFGGDQGLLNVIKDCENVRLMMRKSAELLSSIDPSTKLKIPKGGGVQVLPIQWRHKVAFGYNQETETKPSGRVSPALGSRPPSNTPDSQRGLKTSVSNTDLNDFTKKEAKPKNNASLDDVTLEGVPSIRTLMSDVAMDVLLYMTPKYRQEMINQVTDEMNRIYKIFKKRNKSFNGRVSIYGYSLGSLIAFDILCNQHGNKDFSFQDFSNVGQVDLGDVLGIQGELRSPIHSRIDDRDLKYKNLDFKCKNFFAVGSPLGIFLLLRNDYLRPFQKSEKVIGYVRADVESIYNIFHPYGK